MSDPEVLVLHTVDASHWTSADDLVDALAERLPDLDVRVARTPPESRALVGDADVVLAAHLPDDLLAAADRLDWVQALSAGVDMFDRDALCERGVVLTSAAGVHAEPIAEQVLGYLLVFERGIHTGLRQQARGVWRRYEGGEIRGKTLGIVGLGSIGGRVASYGDAFGMTVVGTKRDPSSAPEAVDEAVDEALPPDGLFEVIERADYLVVACPLTEETRGLLGWDELTAMRDDAVLVNVARGEVVDEEALAYVCQQGAIRGAALDVFAEEPLPADSRLWDLPNVVVTPHMAGSTPHKSARVAETFATNYRAYVGDDPDGYVNRVV
ncbi:MAG: D-2-hydroxyacid dehydrogenase [Haloferacaceae archaeon]